MLEVVMKKGAIVVEFLAARKDDFYDNGLLH